MESEIYHEHSIIEPKRPKKRVPEDAPKPAEMKPPQKEDDFKEWEEVAKDLRQEVEKAVDAKAFTASEEAWFAEGDKPYSEDPQELKKGEGFTEQDKKWFTEGEKPWEGEGEKSPNEGRNGGARK